MSIILSWFITSLAFKNGCGLFPGFIILSLNWRLWKLFFYIYHFLMLDKDILVKFGLTEMSLKSMWAVFFSSEFRWTLFIYAVWSCCRCSLPGGVQGQVRWGPGQPGLTLNVEVGSPAHGRGSELDDPWIPFQAILWFYYRNANLIIF